MEVSEGVIVWNKPAIKNKTMIEQTITATQAKKKGAGCLKINASVAEGLLNEAFALVFEALFPLSVVALPPRRREW